jgi:asparagine synthase (glutamine-hydrolysing)
MGFRGRWTRATGVATVDACTPSATTRRIDWAGGTLLLFGQCFAADAEISAACQEMGSATGAGALPRWPGSYSTAFVSPAGVALRTDPTGQFPLCVAETAGNVWFGSHAADLATAIGAPVDRVSLAVSVAAPEIGELREGRSMHVGVRTISDGRFLTIGPAGIQDREYAALRVDPDADFTESADLLRLSLTNAVRIRTRLADTTFDFSGGIDSTSLVLLAGRHLDWIHGLTYVNPAAPVTDDVEHARHHARLAGGLRRHLVHGTREHLPYQRFSPPTELPHGSLVATGPLRARLQYAAELGSKVHVVGEGGDVVVGAPHGYLADLARRGDVVRLWQHCMAWGRLRARSPLAVFRRAVLTGRTTRCQALRDLASAIEAGRADRRDTWETGAIAHVPRPWAHWLTPAARRSLAEHVRDVADRRTTAPDVGVGDATTAEWVRQQALTLGSARAVGAEYGIEVHAPFMDTDVVRACVSVPAHRRADPKVPKPLLRAALSGLVPDAVLARGTKGNYTRDAHLGVRRAATALRRLMAEPVAADLGVLEPAPVRAVLDRAVQGMPTPWGALNQVFAVETWLRHREEVATP